MIKFCPEVDFRVQVLLPESPPPFYHYSTLSQLFLFHYFARNLRPGCFPVGNNRYHLKTTTCRRSKMAPKSPIMVIIVSVVISGLCTGHPVSRSWIYRFLQIMQANWWGEVLHNRGQRAKGLPARSRLALIRDEKGLMLGGK